LEIQKQQKEKEDGDKKPYYIDKYGNLKAYKILSDKEMERRVK